MELNKEQKELKEKIDNLIYQIHNQINTTTFPLDKQSMDLQNQLFELRQKCQHIYDNDKCIICGCQKKTESLSYVSINRIKKVIEKAEAYAKENLKGSEINITFEFLISSLFPNIMKNIDEEMKHQYTLGFIEGLKASNLEEK